MAETALWTDTVHRSDSTAPLHAIRGSWSTVGSSRVDSHGGTAASAPVSVREASGGKATWRKERHRRFACGVGDHGGMAAHTRLGEAVVPVGDGDGGLVSEERQHRAWGVVHVHGDDAERLGRPSIMIAAAATFGPRHVTIDRPTSR